MTIQRIQMTSKTVHPTTVNNSSMVISFVCGCRKTIRLPPNFSTNLLWFIKMLYCVYYYDWFVWNIYFGRWADAGTVDAKNYDIWDFVCDVVYRYGLRVFTSLFQVIFYRKWCKEWTTFHWKLILKYLAQIKLIDKP